MNLDLDELTTDWECPRDEVSAREIVGRDGCELLQMRVDLGVLQMFVEDRPDGTRYHGMPTVLEYLMHETRAGRNIKEEDWAALDRELCQVNYRRIALAHLAERSLSEREYADARRHLRRVLRDIGAALETLRLISEQRNAADDNMSLRPTLIFNRARLSSQLAVVEARYEDAIEHAEAGAHDLEAVLTGAGMDAESVEQDPGIAYLVRLGRELRDQYDIQMTLKEQLDEAIENEDFETAAALRDKLEQREQAPPRPRED